MSDYSKSFLKVELCATGGYKLDVIGPEKKASIRTLKQRLSGLQPFLDLAKKEFARLGFPDACFRVQIHDECPEESCFCFDAPASCESSVSELLIPDPYALGSEGFKSLQMLFKEQPLPPWRQRVGMAIWRGSSTGFNNLTNENIKTNLRYQLCLKSHHYPRLLDAKITRLVQAKDLKEETYLIRRLIALNLLSDRLNPRELALHRWIIEIDGNVNSWGFLWKLMSGSCIIKVGSNRIQWYYKRLKEWVHYVPVNSDLSNLEEILDWCISNPKICEEIAKNGHSIAYRVINEMYEDQHNAVRSYAKRTKC